jgi:hypothetical protein
VPTLFTHHIVIHRISLFLNHKQLSAFSWEPCLGLETGLYGIGVTNFFWHQCCCNIKGRLAPSGDRVFSRIIQVLHVLHFLTQFTLMRFAFYVSFEVIFSPERHTTFIERTVKGPALSFCGIFTVSCQHREIRWWWWRRATFIFFGLVIFLDVSTKGLCSGIGSVAVVMLTFKGFDIPVSVIDMKSQTRLLSF